MVFFCFESKLWRLSGGFSLCLLVSLLLLSGYGSSITSKDDVYALNVFFTSVGEPSSSLLGWTSSPQADPCSDNWKGVTCIGPNVTELKLSGLSLAGGLGYAMDRLSSLKILDLSNNQLTGEIPFQLPPNVQKLFLSSNQLIRSLPYSLTYLTKLTSLNISNNHLSESIPDIFHHSLSLTQLDLSNNNLQGFLPPSFRDLMNLSTLHVQNNNIGGTIDVLATLPLKDLDVSNNNFTGKIPESLTSLPSFGYLGNHFNITVLTYPPLLSPSPSPSLVSSTVPTISSPEIAPHLPNFSKKVLSPGFLAGIIVASLMTISLFILMCLFLSWRGKARTVQMEQAYVPDTPLKLKYLPVSDVSTPKGFTAAERLEAEVIHKRNVDGSITATAYTIGELMMATNNFNQENLLGEGTSARVYKGKFSNGKILAVKKLDSSSISMMHEKDFLELVVGVSRLRHANISELVGYCVQSSHHILVYDYMINGSLHEALHLGEEKSIRLSWNLRMKIALGAARALEYLHEVCQPMVVHRNFKSSNILLDEDFNPYLSDCGLLPLTSFATQVQFSSQHTGSFGYSAPEFAMSGMYSAKCDVYSFGVMLLELLTGQKPLDSSRPRAEQSLVRWAIPQLNDIDALSKMVDPSLKGMYPAKSLTRFADVISQCVQPESECRPLMSEVVQSLVRLVQRASANKRRSSGDDQAYSQRFHATPEVNE